MDIMILEDEPRTAKLLKEFIEQTDLSHKIVCIADSIETSLDYLKACAKQPDLFFMDIQLADGLSFELFRKTEISSPVVFCTAYEHYALEAFKANGIDYILKPYEEKTIAAAFDKLKLLKKALIVDSNKAGKMIEAIEAPKKLNNSILVHIKDKILPIAVKDIAAVVLEYETVYLYLFTKEKYPLFKTLEDVASLLNPDSFFRINRQMLINRDAVKELEPYFNRKLLVHLLVYTDEKPVVSRLKVSSFLSWIEQG